MQSRAEGNENLLKKVELRLYEELGSDIPALTNSDREMKKPGDTIPKRLQNSSEQKTDVDYLFDEVDSRETLDFLLTERESVKIKHCPEGRYAECQTTEDWQEPSDKIISRESPKNITVGGVKTARCLAKNIN